MRKELQKIEGERTTFTGTFERYGYKGGYMGASLKTVLLINITNPTTGQVYSDHCWFNCTQDFAALGELQKGDLVQFDARVKRYVKGYRGRHREGRLDNPPAIDYRLSHPTKVTRCSPVLIQPTD